MQTSVSGTAYELAFREWEATADFRRQPIRAFDLLAISPINAAIKLDAVSERAAWLKSRGGFYKEEPAAYKRACEDARAQLALWHFEIKRCQREREAARSIAEMDADDLAAGRRDPAVQR